MSSLFNPDYLLHLCKKFGLSPSKQYGQNYLIDEEVIERIIEAANVTADDTVIEVGPGFGVLTLPLAERVGRLVSFEIEKKLEPYWHEIKERNWNRETKNKKIGDVLEVVWGNVLKQFSDWEFTKYKVVANLPYQITSAVIRLFLESPHPPSEMIFMVQKEVAERICAAPGDMSLLAISVQYYAQADYLFTVPRSSFWPSPQVDSAVIKIVKKKKEAKNQEFTDNLFKLVKAGFANRRKLLFKNLLPTLGKEYKSVLEAAFQKLGLLPTVRAQELSVEQWQELVEMLFKSAR